MSSLKIEGAAFVVTVDAERRIVRDASVLIEDERITYVGKAADVANLTAERVIDARGCVVTPAFVNGHIHISYAHAVRGIFRDDFVGRERLLQVFRLQSAMTAEEEYATSLLAIVELLKGGTVTFVDPGSTKFLDACLQVYEDSGCRVVTGLSLIDVDSPLQLPRFSTEEALARTEAFIKTYDRAVTGRVRAWAMPFGTDTATPELLRGAKRLADSYGTGITIHHNSTPALRERYGRSATAFLQSLGVLGPNVLVAHATGISSDEVALLGETRTPVVICPSTAFKEGTGLADRRVSELLAAGVDVAIGSDSANSSNYLDAVRAINAMAVGVKTGLGDVSLVPAEQALEMATIMGARALGLGSTLR